MTEKTLRDNAAGGIVWRQQFGEVTVAVIHRTRYGDEWALPKGKLEEGETSEEAAVREVCEEIGCKKNTITVVGSAGEITYNTKGKPKIVRFWNMIIPGDQKLEKTDVEVDAVQFLPVEKAINLLTHPEQKSLLKKNKVFGDENCLVTKKAGRHPS